MSSQTSFGRNMLFQTINDDLNASLATADELSKEFNSLFKEVSSNNNSTESALRTSTVISRERDRPQSPKLSSTSVITSGSSNGTNSSMPFSSSSTSFHQIDSVMSSNRNAPPSPIVSTSSITSPISRNETSSPLPRSGSSSYSYSQQSPKQSPLSPRRNSPSHYDRNSQISPNSYMDRSPSPNPSGVSFDQPSRTTVLHSPSKLLGPYDSNSMGRRSPRPDRIPSPLSFNHPLSSTLPRNFGIRQPDGGVQRQRSPGKWNETDLDVSFERKPHHTYDKTEWLRPSVQNINWKESNLDGPPPAPSPKKDPRSQPSQFSQGSLPRNMRISMPPDLSNPDLSPYYTQPIISRISIPPTSAQTRQHRPIPLSVIMRLQNPYWGAMATRPPRALGGEGDMASYQPAIPIPREFFRQPVSQLQQQLPQPQQQLPQPQQQLPQPQQQLPQPHQQLPQLQQQLPQPHQQPPELRQPVIYSDVLNPADIDAELERLDYVHEIPVISEHPNIPEEGEQLAPRPLSPTRLQPVVAPEAQSQQIPDLEELLRIRAEIPRALKRRGSVDQSLPLKKASYYQPNQYKNLIDKLFRRKDRRQKGEQDIETSSSSDGEEAATPPARVPAPPTSTLIPTDFRSYNSILRRSNRQRNASGNRARLSPLVLLLDGALVGELETVQRAVQEMNDPSQANDEGITALHNSVCGGHYNVVDFLVRSGANVSAPDSHGWTPLHCAASCNDRALCEFLVRNGAAVMAITESDSATASQKCDPYAVGFEECESFLKGMEEAMGVENSGVLYALWSYPAQAADELSFKEGDMVTILQKPEGSDWWWASLCGREGFVPNNYFGLFPKVRPKSLC